VKPLADPCQQYDLIQGQGHSEGGNALKFSSDFKAKEADKPVAVALLEGSKSMDPHMGELGPNMQTLKQRQAMDNSRNNKPEIPNHNTMEAIKTTEAKANNSNFFAKRHQLRQSNQQSQDDSLERQPIHLNPSQTKSLKAALQKQQGRNQSSALNLPNKTQASVGGKPFVMTLGADSISLVAQNATQSKNVKLAASVEHVVS